jgi:hypothetical protein
MNLIPISKDTMINVDMIESIEIRKIKGDKTIVITIGGKQHIPTIDSHEILKSLITSGAAKATKQFFAV